MDWTGDTASCTPGEISMEFKLRMFQRMNYFRDVVGVGQIEYDATLDYQQQASALVLAYMPGKIFVSSYFVWKDNVLILI